MKRKAAVIWNEIEQLRYFIVEGDLRKFQGIYVNSVADNDEEEALQQELNDFVYKSNEELTEKGMIEGDYFNVKFCSIDEIAAAVREGADLIECGFIP